MTEGLPIREFESVMGAQLGGQEEAAITAQSVEIMDIQVKRIRNFFGFFKNSQKDQKWLRNEAFQPMGDPGIVGQDMRS